MEKVDEDASPEFKWLKRKSFGGKKKEFQFYESFIYDGVKYMLYDCVYMYKEGLREPYIGKLIKIWEVRDNKTKKVKVQWFFRPEEISKWLGNTTTLKNEIFFASGEGVGLANINLLETIAGRCNVVCVSKDPRNPQPSDKELKAADFVFYRTFDVKSCSILDKMEEKVGGLEIQYVFNRKEGETENTSALPGSTSDRKEENQNTTTCGEVPQPLNKSLTNKLKDDKEDIKLAEKAATKGESLDKDISKKLAEISKGNSRLKEMAFGKDKAGKDEMKASTVSVHKVEAKERNKPSTGSDKLHDRPCKKVMPDDKNPPKETQVEIEVAGDSERSKDMPSKESKVDKSLSGYDKLHERPLKKIKSDEKAAPKEKQVELEAPRDDAERLKDMPSKKSKVENSRKLPVDGNSKHGEKLPLHAKNEKDLKKSDKEKNKAPMGSDNLHDRPLKKMKSVDKTTHKEIPVEVEAVKEAEGLTNSVKLPVDGVSEHEETATPVNKSYGKNGKVLPGSDKGKGSEKVADDLEGGMLNKTKADGSFKMPDNKKSNSVQKLSVNTNGSNGKDLQSGDHKRKLLVSKSPKVADLTTDRDKKTTYEEFVVGPKPNAEKSGWFRQLPWDERLKNAYEIGTAVLLYNVDPNYTSRDVEEIIWHALAEHCAAKILQRTAVSSPHYGQALILLKTKDAARRVLAKLDEECLMLSNGRPLVAITCPRILVKKNSNFFGHLAIDKIRLQNQRPMDEAVSTSHFSQPNTIEYDLAMEWCLLQSRSKKWWEMIHKQQGEELRKLKITPPKK